MGEKWEASKWVFWAVVMGLIIIAIGYGLWPIGKRVEREVLIHSHQYKEGMADRAAVLESALAEIEIRLASGVDEQTKNDLEAQRAAINIQLNAMRRLGR